MNSLVNIEKVNIEQFRSDLISWFKSEQRELPWRLDRNPYKIWVSEIMLQQTRVDTVIPYFHRFIEQFPTLKDLADADEERVLKAWEGLGYYSRVRNLQSAVKEVQEKYSGIVPNTPQGISALKGVGPYTAGAILSIAYGIPEPAVDGNVMRVLSRILLIWEDIARPQTRKIFEEAVRKLISKEEPSEFNQALMELGALICTPTSPSCLLCPVRDHCIAFNEGVQTKLPIKSKKKKQREVQLASAIIESGNGKILIRKRPAEGLLASLWEFPSVEILLPIENDKQRLIGIFKEIIAEEITIEEYIGQVQHVFSHLIWKISVYSGTLEEDERIEAEGLRMVSVEELANFALPVPHQKMLGLYLERKGNE